VIINK